MHNYKSTSYCKYINTNAFDTISNSILSEEYSPYLFNGKSTTNHPNWIVVGLQLIDIPNTSGSKKYLAYDYSQTF